jgi:hypothetical protein
MDPPTVRKENVLKKSIKKLALHRETLLELDRLGSVIGRAATQTCRPDFCDFSGRATCTTCELTCTTNYC